MNATEWTTKSVNELPDSAFAYIEPGGSKDAVGKTIPRSLRHLPFKTASGDVEPILLEKAIENVSKIALPEITKARLAKKLAEVATTMPPAEKPPCECGDEHCSGTMKRKAVKDVRLKPGRDPESRRTIDYETVSPAPMDEDKLVKDYEAFCATIKSSDPGSRVQSLAFDADRYSAKDARGWANDHGFKTTPAREVGGMFHIAQSAEAFDELRPIALSEGITAIIGMPVKTIEAVQRAFASAVGNTFKSADLAKAVCEVVEEDAAGTVVFRVKVAERAYHFAVQGIEAAHLPFYASKQAYVPIVKMENEQRYTLSVVYPASAKDNPKPDFHGDVMSQEELEKSAWSFMSKGTDRIGLMHRPGSQGAGRVVESYIWRGPEWKMRDAGGKDQSVSPGDWVMGIVWEPAAWDQIKQGGITGLSLQGAARKEAF